MAADIDVFGDHLKYAFGKFVDELITSAKNGKQVAKAAPAPAPKVEEEPEEVPAETVEHEEPLVKTGVALDREEVESLPIVALRALAKENGIEAKKKADILAAFEDGGFFSTSDAERDEEDEEEDETEPEPDEDDDEEESEEELPDDDEPVSREELQELTLRELRALAKDAGHDPADIKGLDQEGLIDLLLEEEDSDEEGEEDADEDEEVEIDRETLEEMSDAELKEIVKQFSIKLPKKANRKTIINTILDAAESAEDDEDEDDE